MTKKTLKRVSKKKQLTKKKGLRKHLTKNLTNEDQATSPNIQNLRQTLTPTPNGKSLRSSLLMGMSSPLFGMAPQQYGNITNEKNIRDAQNKNQTLAEQNNNDKRTIEDLTAENKKLKDKKKELKQKLKEKQNEHDRLDADVDIAQDNLNENKRVEYKMDVLKNKKQHLDIEAEEYNTKNDIIKYKTEIDEKEAALHGLKMENQRLQREYEKNHYYHELEKLKEDVQIYETKNKGLSDAMETEDFKNPNKDLVAQYKKLALAKRKYEILQQKEKKQKELIDSQLLAASIPDAKDYEAATNEAAARMKDIEGQIFEQKKNIEEGSRPIRQYEHSVKKLEEASNRLFDTQIEYNAIQAKQAKLNTEAKDNDLQKRIEVQMKLIGEQEAKNDKATMKTKNSRKILDLKMNEARQNAYNAKINEDLTEDEKNELKKAGELEAQNNAQNQLNDISLTNRKARFNLAKAKANEDFMNSQAMKDINEKIIKTETETKYIQNEIDQRGILMKAQKQRQETDIMNTLSINFVQDGLSETEQVSYMMDKMIQPKIDAFHEKTKLMQELMQLRRPNINLWDAFIREYDKTPIIYMLNEGGYLNVSEEEIRNVIRAFDQYLKSRPPPPTEFNNNNNDDDFL